MATDTPLPLQMHFEVIEAQYLTEQRIEKTCRLLDMAYHNSKMAARFMEDLKTPGLKQLCGFVLTDSDDVVGFRVMKPYQGAIPEEIMAGYTNVHGKHLVVHPDVRGLGLGSKLVHDLNQEAKKFFDTDIIWGSSAEVGAMRLYQRLGAIFYMKSIQENNLLITPEDNLLCFKAFMNSPRLNTWRFSEGIGFAYALSQEAQDYLFANGFAQIPQGS